MRIFEIDIKGQKLKGKELLSLWRKEQQNFSAKIQLRVGLPSLGPTIEITLITSNDRGKGHASQALKRLTQLADQLSVRLSLNPSAIGAKNDPTVLSNEQLEAWYGRYGFVQSPKEEYYMVREPN